MGVLSCRVGRDDGLASAFLQPVPKSFGIICSVGDETLRHGNVLHEQSSAGQIMSLPGCEGERKRAAGSIGQGVNFSRPSAPRSADGLCKVPPFAPDAERCALM